MQLSAKRIRAAFTQFNDFVHPVEAAIKDFLVKKHNREASSNYSHAPSQIGSPCLRKIYYSYFKTLPDSQTDYGTAKIFEMGNFVEDMLMSWLKARDLSIEYIPPPATEFSGKPQFPISVPEMRVMRGYIDNLAIVQDKLMLQEIKSCSASKFDGLTEPMRDHLVQVSLYWLALNRDLANDKYGHIQQLAKYKKLDGVTLIYLNKNTAELKFFDVAKSTLSTTLAQVSAKLEMVNKFVDSGRLPPKTVDKCNYCSYKNKCSKNWNNIKVVTS